MITKALSHQHMNNQTVYIVTDLTTYESNKVVGVYFSREEAENMAVQINFNGESWGFGENERSACVQEMTVGQVNK